MQLPDLIFLRALNYWALPAGLMAFSLLTCCKFLALQKLWQAARWLTLLGLLLALIGLLNTVLHGAQILTAAPLLHAGCWGTVSLNLRADRMGSTFLVMVNLISWIIMRFSHHYLNGEAGQRRYLAALLMTLAGVNLVVMTNNVVILASAWLIVSLALHELLTFYPNRSQAVFAAHKKFIISRLADLCLFGAIGLIGHATGTLEFDQLAVQVASMPVLPLSLQVAALLLALTAALKCAQLPFHGWLIQVMEAPTPVSALLHAGIVNLGGLLLIRFSFLMTHCAAAQIFLVVLGSLTTAIAAMVMMTRVTIKVTLAWSTCAQMGFMLMQCGLGMVELAALHVLAHSLYKAHAFLNSGTTNARVAMMTGPTQAVSLWRRLGAGLLAILVVALAARLAGLPLAINQPLSALLLIVALALAPLLDLRTRKYATAGQLSFVLAALGLTVLYLVLHWVFASGLQLAVVDHAGWMELRVGWVLFIFTALYLLQSLILSRPDYPLCRRLYPYFYAGLFLDDLFTRMTFRLWPARADIQLPASAVGTSLFQPRKD